MTHNAIAKEIVDAAYKIHTGLGPGLLESVYEVILADDLQNRGLHVIRQAAIPITFNNIHFRAGFRADLLVEHLVIVEIKSVEAVAPVHHKQILTQLRLSQKKLGLLINFNVVLIKDGITRVVNGLD